jgi:hypothetical protein
MKDRGDVPCESKDDENSDADQRDADADDDDDVGSDDNKGSQSEVLEVNADSVDGSSDQDNDLEDASCEDDETSADNNGNYTDVNRALLGQVQSSNVPRESLDGSSDQENGSQDASCQDDDDDASAADNNGDYTDVYLAQMGHVPSANAPPQSSDNDSEDSEITNNVTRNQQGSEHEVVDLAVTDTEERDDGGDQGEEEDADVDVDDGDGEMYDGMDMESNGDEQDDDQQVASKAYKRYVPLPKSLINVCNDSSDDEHPWERPRKRQPSKCLSATAARGATDSPPTGKSKVIKVLSPLCCLNVAG